MIKRKSKRLIIIMMITKVIIINIIMTIYGNIKRL